MAVDVWTRSVNRGAPSDLMGRLTVRDIGSPARTASPILREGYLIRQADVSSISAKAYLAGVQVGTTQSPSVASVIYDTLQTTATWGWVQGGGNAHYQAPASFFDVDQSSSQGPRIVRVQVELTLADATKIEWLWDITVNQVTG